MQSTDAAYGVLAEKFLRTTTFPEVIIPDSLIQLLKYMYTEEEVEIVSKMSWGMKGAKSIAKMVNRPVEEVKPILDSLGKRILIVGITGKRMSLYGLMPFYPGIYEAQMILAEKKMREEGDDGSWWGGFVRLFQSFWEEYFGWLKSQPGFAAKYGILGVPYGRVITIEQAIDASPGLGVIAVPTDKYSEMVERAKKSLALLDVCTCREEMALIGGSCHHVDSPTTVTCSLMGLAAEGAVRAGVARRVSKEEFLEVRMRATEAGLISMVDNMKDPILVCSCCKDCCSILRVLNQFNHPNALTRSRFEAAIDPEKCNGCAICSKACPLNAITVGDDKKALVDSLRCIGCGICVVKCDKQNAITLKERETYTPPADNMAEFWIRRYFELKGKENDLFPKLTLGAARVLSKISPVHVTGPRAPRFKDKPKEEKNG